MIALAAKRRLFLLRFAQASFCGLLGSAITWFCFVLGQTEAQWAAVLFSGLLAFGIAVLERSPLAQPAKEIDPAQDADGLVRCALALPNEHPLAGTLLPLAQTRPMRFRSHPWLAPLAIAGIGVLVAWVWVGNSATSIALRYQEQSTASSSAAAPKKSPVPLRTDQNNEGMEDRFSSAETELDWKSISLASNPKTVRAASLAGVPPTVVQHFLELRATTP
jgi:hypothetical protein